jgi:aspartyl aminopeptidase
MLEAKPSPHILPISVFWNHEEIGSGTTEGAHSPFMQDLIKILSKIYGIKGVDRLKWKENSLCISSDAAHALHPNYPEKHDESAPPELGKGIVIKHNAAKKYATSAATESFIREVCQKYHVPYQHFVSHSEMPSGSTIGPIFAETTGIPTVDIGVPQLAMHSAREVMAIEDEIHLCNLLKGALEYDGA